MAKLRGTEAEIYARLRELTEEFRQLRRELADTTHRRVTVKGKSTERQVEPVRVTRSQKSRAR